MDPMALGGCRLERLGKWNVFQAWYGEEVYSYAANIDDD
jgi:hypothetical protein